MMFWEFLNAHPIGIVAVCLLAIYWTLDTAARIWRDK